MKFEYKGNEVIVHNLSSYCKKHGLAVGSMYDLAHGRQKSYKNWTINKILFHKKASKYCFIDSLGSDVHVDNLRKFCIENGLKYKSMIDLANGRRRTPCIGTNNSFVSVKEATQ